MPMPSVSKLLFILAVSLLTLSSQAIAANEHRDGALVNSDHLAETALRNSCLSLARECFAYGSEHFVNCLRVSANHSFCSGSELGQLISKRWQMSPSLPSFEDAEAFMGPSLVNKECLKSFDSLLSAHLGADSPSSEVLQMLNQSLERCRQQPSNDLLRP